MAKENILTRKKREKVQSLMNQGQYAEACALLEQLCHHDKQNSGAWFDLGTAYVMQNNFVEAARCYQHVVSIDPLSAEANFNLGKALAKLDQKQASCDAYQQALKIKPTWVQALNNLGNVQQSLGLYDAALESYRRALEIQPDYTEPYLNRGNVLVYLGYSREAARDFQQALTLNPNHLLARRNLCTCLVQLGELDEAINGYQQLQALIPNSPEPTAAIGKILELKGDKQAAYELLQPLLTRYPDNPKVANLFADLCKYVNRCGEAIAMLESILANQTQPLTRDVESETRFAVAQLYDKAGAYDNAFKHFQRANILKARPFDIEHYRRYIDDIIHIYSKQTLATLPQATIAGDRAVFIVGMPRSGTSLTEQILASHHQVSGGGELDKIVSIITELPTQVENFAHYPHFQLQLTSELSNKMAQSYLDSLAEISSDSRYVTDKMPQNFQYLGLISRLFPGAHIIHCQRDPRDTCLSCYFQDFFQGQSYSYDLTTLGQYYLEYQRLMQHWEQVLELPILNIQYEELVSNQEQVTRQMLDFLNLPWDDNCLQFHNNTRLIRTASYEQVRQPIHSRSAGRWKNYEAYLGPLLEALKMGDIL